ncbi:NAD-dependent epimerase/dehydratase family protein [Curvibacter sp. APW13]|uniref:UDP-2-acetamido-2,6-beta-L-arabino-hexul-4-ose reductase n=1 Tax=Curvibacter sp. APW13 TaxID=3077236 RepID=UPI0028DDB5F8|nr:NAD-dependent epimerase/dehydratase family protein [Curvibacter sp. APW13]MDT8993087.1 NAD-dependent epimerase/dehydratase family protein [Curvibacter sp. APW13]
MRVLITGADGFIGRNLRLRLTEAGYDDVQCVTRATSQDELRSYLGEADFVFHLAGVNRPQDPSEFMQGNADLTQRICSALESAKRPATIVLASSMQATADNAYGHSKRMAEQIVWSHGAKTGGRVHVFRLPNVFGKWARPNYNSVVATFCHNVARGLPVQVHDGQAKLTLTYIDDVLDRFLALLHGADPAPDAHGCEVVTPQYSTTVAGLLSQIEAFRDARDSLMMPPVGRGLVRALYSTYVSYLPSDRFSYLLPCHEDARGVFVEMLKTPDCGQFSYLTAHPGVTRGGHYHHSKTEKFLVIKGQARFRFRHMQTGQMHELETRGEKPMVVETVPGWTHDITNIGTDEMIVMLWANEVFDRDRPDTISCPV